MRGDTLSWMICGYKPENKDRLLVFAVGNGDFDEFKENIPEDKPVYMYLNFKFGDTVCYLPFFHNRQRQTSRCRAHGRYPSPSSLFLLSFSPSLFLLLFFFSLFFSFSFSPLSNFLGPLTFHRAQLHSRQPRSARQSPRCRTQR